MDEYELPIEDQFCTFRNSYLQTERVLIENFNYERYVRVDTKKIQSAYITYFAHMFLELLSVGISFVKHVRSFYMIRSLTNFTIRR